jgi:hypothetical protein
MHALMHLPEPQFIADFAWSWSEDQRLQVLHPHWEEQSGLLRPRRSPAGTV